ncbi:SDR family NAD(P)-dependent oxidoreductase [Nonomuraea antimicrobica]
MDMRLTGKTAVVTGASRGIGLAITQALAGEGMRVVAAARTITPALKETGATALTADLSTSGGPAELIGRALAELGEIDLLVNNVGGGDVGDDHVGGFLGFADEHWVRDYDLNFLSAVRATRAALPSLLRSRGTVVNVSSNGARMPHAGPVTYTTAKAALTAFGKALAEEFGPQGVRVNTISPGATRTSLWESPTGTAPRWPPRSAWSTSSSSRACRRAPA